MNFYVNCPNVNFFCWGLHPVSNLFLGRGEGEEGEDGHVGLGPAEEGGEVGVEGSSVYGDWDGVDVDVKNFGFGEEGEHCRFRCVEDKPGLD